MEMLRGMRVLRGITAAYVTADVAHAQVYPAIASLHALFAAVGARSDRLDLIHVWAWLTRHSKSPLGVISLLLC